MNMGEQKNVLITGGTSGLGKSIFKQLVADNYRVVTIGRKEAVFSEKMPFFNCDFSDLSTIPKVVEVFASENMKFDILINNAGILSTPAYKVTVNGFESSYQINFLSHVLITRLLLQNKMLNPKLIINISSPIYKIGKIYADDQSEKDDHGLFQTYANTKLYMALFSKKLADEGYSSFSFNPGTFSSGIYRSQKKWFQHIYKVAAPFMTSSDRVAKVLCSIIGSGSWSNGFMMDKHSKPQELIMPKDDKITLFWEKIDRQLSDLCFLDDS